MMRIALSRRFLALGGLHLVEVELQDDGHRFGAMSPQIPLIVSDRGAQSIAHHRGLPGIRPPSQIVSMPPALAAAPASASVTKTAQSIRSAARGSAPWRFIR
jgi:hypothetical protein